MTRERTTLQGQGGVLLVAPDKFRGSLSASQVIDAAAAAARTRGWTVLGRPMADGGEGMLEAFGGPNRSSVVTGPAGDPVEAVWRLDDGVAVIESALASGLLLAGGGELNDPVAATSRGTGELIAQAVRDGAQRVIVGLGGSAMTDGGLGAFEAVVESLGERPSDRGVELLVACDVETVFTEAANVFGPQKGASPEQVRHLTERLHEVRRHYERHEGRWLADHGVDLGSAPGGGAAGGLGGALLVLGGRLVPGLRLVAEQVGLDSALREADAVVTGEGALDAESFNGKVVGGVVEAAQGHELPVLIVAGVVRDQALVPSGEIRVADLSERFGPEASWAETVACVERAVADFLEDLGAARGWRCRHD